MQVCNLQMQLNFAHHDPAMGLRPLLPAHVSQTESQCVAIECSALTQAEASSCPTVNAAPGYPETRVLHTRALANYDTLKTMLQKGQTNLKADLHFQSHVAVTCMV